uniref:G-protein coupled receptors family 1 profile domain-containing protein n=1 Tax=Xenopus tropicalis TaxID=8364 RepID=A0A6I8SVY2_XENTR
DNGSVSEIYQNTTAQGSDTTVPTANILCTLILLITFLFGLVVNVLYLWILGLKMSKSVNTAMIFHLILVNLVFTMTMPLLSVYMLTFPQWILGDFMCKLVNSLLSLCIYTTVFFLTVISLDRYTLVFHPVWYRGHMNHRYASVTCILLWGFAASSPYFAFRQIRLLDDNETTICYNDYSLTGKWDNEQKAIVQMKWLLFSFRLVLCFLLPFSVITVCYLKIALKMKKGNLVKSSKPYKIIFIAVTSFFLSFIPYHLWYGMSIEEGIFRETTLNGLKLLATCLACFHYCFTPVLYLFIAENFKKTLRKSILSLIESVFSEAFNSWNKGFDENRSGTNDKSQEDTT